MGHNIKMNTQNTIITNRIFYYIHKTGYGLTSIYGVRFYTAVFLNVVYYYRRQI